MSAFSKNHFSSLLHHSRSALLCTCILGGSLTFAGCSKPSTDVRSAADLFFSSYNHLCEADTLDVSGTVDVAGLSGDYKAQMVAKPAELALQFENDADGLQIAFYIKDGKTYLNYMGTKSSSVAANIGIEEDTELHLPNPFLEISRSDREKLFDSVKVSNDTYTFTLNRSETEKFLDSYGAVEVNKAILEATIENETLRSMSIEVDGIYSVDKTGSPLSLKASMNVDAADTPVTVEFPDDLTSWPVQ